MSNEGKMLSCFVRILENRDTYSDEYRSHVASYPGVGYEAKITCNFTSEYECVHVHDCIYKIATLHVVVLHVCIPYRT